MRTREPARMVVLAAILLCALALGGCGSASDDLPGASPSAGHTDALTVQEARAAEVGDHFVVRGALVSVNGETRACDALAESYPPQCPNGLIVTGYPQGLLLSDGQSAQGVHWVESVRFPATRTAQGLQYGGKD